MVWLQLYNIITILCVCMRECVCLPVGVWPPSLKLRDGLYNIKGGIYVCVCVCLCPWNNLLDSVFSLLLPTIFSPLIPLYSLLHLHLISFLSEVIPSECVCGEYMYLLLFQSFTRHISLSLFIHSSICFPFLGLNPTFPPTSNILLGLIF